MAEGVVNTVVNPQTLDSQNSLNWKVQSDRPINAANLALENAVSDQQLTRAIEREALQTGIAVAREWASGAINIGRATQARVIRYIFEPGAGESAGEAVSFAKTISSDLSSKLSDLQGMLASGQQQEKTAITTPPQTGTGGSFGSSPGTALYAQLGEALALVNALRNVAPAPGGAA